MDTPADQSQLAIRSRTNAALVFGFHSGLRRIPKAPQTLARRPARRVNFDVAAEDDDGEPGTFGLAGQIAKWVAMLAAIAAPWVLLLTG